MDTLEIFKKTVRTTDEYGGISSHIENHWDGSMSGLNHDFLSKPFEVIQIHFEVG